MHELFRGCYIFNSLTKERKNVIVLDTARMLQNRCKIPITSSSMTTPPTAIPSPAATVEFLIRGSGFLPVPMMSSLTPSPMSSSLERANAEATSAPQALNYNNTHPQYYHRKIPCIHYAVGYVYTLYDCVSLYWS